MKKSIIAALVPALLSLTLAACGGSNAEYGADSDGADAQGSADLARLGEITPVSREEGSGTRSAFVELFDVRDADKNDLTTLSAEITNTTAVMMTSVAGDAGAIGYISLGSLNDTVKALRIDGTAPSVAAVKDGSYTISRPFAIVTMGEPGSAARDFIAFIRSADGQSVIESKGYIYEEDPAAPPAPYAGAAPAAGETLDIAGSSSVTPVMEALKEAYAKVRPGVDIRIQQSDSSTGINATVEGVCDIGMSSRELKDSELEKGLVAVTIALDGIAVIVNNDNPADGLSKETVRDIFKGDIANWADVSAR